jgi:uncharacterized protein (TIGR00255 family)
MTGYGRAEIEMQGRVWSVEIRSVNNRFLDTKVKLPRDYGVLEDGVRKMVGQYHRRGRVDLSITLSGDFSDLVEVKVDEELGRTYKEALANLAETIGLEPDIDLRMIAAMPDVLIRQQLAEDYDAVWPHLEKAAHAALTSCLDMREREGATLTGDLVDRLNFFSEVLDTIENHVPELIRQRENGLVERLEKLLDNVEVDQARLAQEIALLADKTDVTEELVRLRSHIGQFQSLLHSTEPVGRKLDFLIQEFLREVNTIGSKINDADIAHKAVELKSELEKMREQVQNIE